MAFTERNLVSAVFALAFHGLLACGRLDAGDVDPAAIEDLSRHSIAVAEETRQKVPGATKPIFDLGRAHQRFGHDDLAVKVYREGLEADPRHPEVLYELGFILSQRDRLDEALAAYREALRWNPELGDAHARIGLILVHQGRHAQAVGEFRAEIENRTAGPLAYTVLGHALRDLKRHLEAIESYREALRLNPAERGAHYGLAQTYQLLGRTGEEAAARAEFKRLKEKDDQASREALAIGGNRPEQLRRTATTYMDAAATYLLAGKLDEAERCARAALKFDPDREGARRLLLDLFRRAGRTGEAMDFCRRLLAGKRTPLVLYQLARLCLETGSPAEAAALLEEAVRIGPEDANAHRALAEVILRGKAPGGPNRALELARRAVELSPREAMSHDIHGWALYKNGDLPAAVESLEAAVQLDPGNQDSRRRLLEMRKQLTGGPR